MYQHYGTYRLLFVVFVACLLGASFFAVAQAQTFAVRITEIMYDASGADTGKEYVEVANIGDVMIPTGSISFTERERTHTVRSASVPLLAPGEVAVITSDPESFVETYGDDGYILLDSGNFSLNNTASDITVSAFGFTHTVTYTAEDGAAGDGAALEVTAQDTVRPRPPTPGIARNLPKPPRIQEPEPERLPGPVIALITDPPVIFSASETLFTVVRDGEVLYGLWNFGDAMVTTDSVVSHAYLHPGVRVLSFEEIPVSRRRDAADPVTLSKEITVITPQLRAERISEAFVRVWNDHSFTLDVSGWELLAGNHRFVFPSNSFIPAGDNIVISFETPDAVSFVGVTAGGGAFPAGESIVEPMPTEETPDDAGENIEPSPPVMPAEKPEPGHIWVWIAILLGLLGLVAGLMFLLSKSGAEKKEKKKK